MTVLNPYHLTVDGLSLGTYAHMIEQVRGIDVLADRRRSPAQVAYRHGTTPTADWYFDEKVLPLLITVSPWDEDGVSALEMQGHLRDNLDELLTIFGKRSLLDVRRFVPIDEGSGGDDLLELQAWATVGRGSVIDGGVNQRQFRIDLILPYPFWHELPQITGATGTFTTGGTAPIADMILTVAGGAVSDGLGHSFTTVGAGIVDVGKREFYQSGILSMANFSLDGGEDNWMEWPAQTEVDLSGATAAYFNARH